MEHQPKAPKKLRRIKTVPAVTCAKREHDINGLLGNIMLRAEYLARRPNLDPELRADLEGFLACVEGIRGIMVGCKTHTLAERAAPHVIDVGSAIELALRMIRMRTPPNINLVIKRPLEPVYLTANESTFSRTLNNLLANALQAIIPEQGTVTASCATIDSFEDIPETTRTAYALPDASYALVRIADTGHGMDEEHVLLAHHAFFTTKPDGHGLGLGVVRDFIEAHRGGMHIESAVGHGTTFSIYLPVGDALHTSTHGSDIHLITYKPTGG